MDTLPLDDIGRARENLREAGIRRTAGESLTPLAPLSGAERGEGGREASGFVGEE